MPPVAWSALGATADLFAQFFKGQREELPYVVRGVRGHMVLTALTSMVVILTPGIFASTPWS